MLETDHMTDAGTVRSDDPYRRGFSAPKHLRRNIAEAHRTRLGYTAGTAVLDIIVIEVATVGGSLAWVHLSQALAILTVPILLLLSARHLRGLECLVHEASHFNWSRRHRLANDLLALTLAGIPTGARIAEYRTGHLLHHGQFGTKHDPDLARYSELDIEALDRGSLIAFTLAVAKRLPRYQLGWLRTLGATPVNVLLLMGWVAAFVVVPPALIFSWDVGFMSALVWLISYLAVLPIIRFVAEAGEHVYRDNRTVFDATISNIGLFQKILFHPHNDGFHTVHHMWPGIPHHALRRTHRLLLAEDTTCYAMKVRYRKRVLQQPVVGLINADDIAAAEAQKEQV